MYILGISAFYHDRAECLLKDSGIITAAKEEPFTRKKHVDYSACIQKVHPETIPRYYALTSKFKEKTACQILVNTSFNVRGEPIICTPTDAFKCFMGTELDLLAIGNYLLLKQDQDQSLKENYVDRYELD